MNNGLNKLRLKRLGINTSYEFIVYIHSNCLVSKSEGFEVETQVLVAVNGNSIMATLNVVNSDILNQDQASLSESAWKALGAEENDEATLHHPSPVTSLTHVRSKVHGNTLKQNEFDQIISDIVLDKYTNIHIASFVTACARDNLNIDEIIYLTRSMIKTGEQITWRYPAIFDKHSVGGIPGNRTTPIVVAIIASAGLIIPKTSSRAITSPAGTADTVETMTPVTLNIEKIRHVVEKEGGCMAWGGTLGLSPADDLIIRVERVLDIDPMGQMIASVLSKKAAVGATDVIIDIPVGPTAKIHADKFELLKEYFITVGAAIGLNIYIQKTDGIQPLGIGIGPALEAKDILAILQNNKDCPIDLKNNAVRLAATLLEAGKKAVVGEGVKLANEILTSGRAFNKFLAICEAQGGFKNPPSAAFTHNVIATHTGQVIEIDNRNLSTIAKLAGAPHDPAAGLEFFAKQGTHIEKGQTLYRIHAETKGELEYALNFAKSMPNIVKLSGDGS